MNHLFRFSASAFAFTAFILSQPCFAEELSTISNSRFSVNVPEDIADISVIEQTDSSITFCEAISYQEYGGFVASISAYESLSDYAGIPNYRRSGALVDTEGKMYDLVIEYPTDVPFDTSSEQATNQYIELSNAMEYIIDSLTPASGYTFIPQDEIDTTGIYADVCVQLNALLHDQADAETLKNQGFSYLYIYSYGQETPAEELIGYAFTDINYDGYDELLIGSMDENDMIIYDMYENIDGDATHIFSSAERDRYYLLSESNAILNEGSNGAAESFSSYYYAFSNQKELGKQFSLIYSEYEDPDQPYFIQYGFDSDMTPLTEDEWGLYQNNFGEKIKPPFQPLASYSS